jgi:hypothetical protein
MCILDRQYNRGLSFDRVNIEYTHKTNIAVYSLIPGACNEAVPLHRDTLSDITQTLMCFDDCSGFFVIEE